MTLLEATPALPERVARLVHFLGHEGRGAGLDRDDVLILFAVGANPDDPTDLGTVMRVTGLDEMTVRRRGLVLVERGFLTAAEPAVMLRRLGLGPSIAA